MMMGSKTNVHFANLSREVEPEELLTLVRKFGTPTSHNFPKDWLGAKRNFCFINFSTEAEARAVVAAMHNHEMRPGRPMKVVLAFQNEGGETQPRQRLFARNLPQNVSVEELRDAFGKFGELIEVTPLFNSTTNTGKGAGFIKYRTVEEAIVALEACNGRVLFPEDAQTVQVCYADPRHKRAERDVMKRIQTQSTAATMAPNLQPMMYNNAGMVPHQPMFIQPAAGMFQPQPQMFQQMGGQPIMFAPVPLPNGSQGQGSQDNCIVYGTPFAAGQPQPMSVNGVNGVNGATYVIVC